MARTTLVAIEQGKRQVRTSELLQLAKLYGTTVNGLLRRETVHLDLSPRFRRSSQTNSAAMESAAKLMNTLVSAEIELERALGIERTAEYPRQRPLQPGPVRIQAEEDAADLRRWIGLGFGPVLDVPELAEMQLGIRVYQYPLESNISGLFVRHQAAGACMMLNANHPKSRIQFSAAHELGHLVADDREVAEVLWATGHPSSPIEQYANQFATAFLMPRRIVRQRFFDVTDGQTHLTRRHIIILAHLFHVSREALVRRLEELKLVQPGAWDWFQENGGITDKQAEQVTGKSFSKPVSTWTEWPLGSIRLTLLAQEAWEHELYSEGQLSAMLQLNRHQLRKLLHEALA